MKHTHAQSCTSMLKETTDSKVLERISSFQTYEGFNPDRWEFRCIDQLSRQPLCFHISTQRPSNLTGEAFLKINPKGSHLTLLKKRRTEREKLRTQTKIFSPIFRRKSYWSFHHLMAYLLCWLYFFQH